MTLAEVNGMFDNNLIQMGFAGFAIIILSMLFWTIKQMIALIRSSDKVMAKLTDAITMLEMSMSGQLGALSLEQRRTSDELRKLTETVNNKPCIPNQGN